MELVSPELLTAVGDLPIVALLVILVFAQFVMFLRILGEMRNDIVNLSTTLNRVFLRFEDLLRSRR